MLDDSIPCFFARQRLDILYIAAHTHLDRQRLLIKLISTASYCIFVPTITKRYIILNSHNAMLERGRAECRMEVTSPVRSSFQRGSAQRACFSPAVV